MVISLIFPILRIFLGSPQNLKNFFAEIPAGSLDLFPCEIWGFLLQNCLSYGHFIDFNMECLKKFGLYNQLRTVGYTVQWVPA